MSDQKQRKINYEDFDLVKFKTLNGDTDVAYYDIANPKVGKQTAELKDKLHDDLLTVLNKLQLYFAKRMGLLEVTDTIRDEFKKSTKVLGRCMELHKEQIARCSVTGLSISGEKQLKGVQISGKIDLPGYGSNSLACAKIIFAGESLGYEAELQEVCEEIRAEVYQHTFKGKRAPKAEDAQTDLEDAIDEAEGKGKMQAV